MLGDISSARIPLREQYPVLRIFDAAGAAFSPSSIVIAIVAAIAIGLAGSLVNQILPVKNAAQTPDQVSWPELPAAERAAIIGRTMANPWVGVADCAIAVLRPDVGFVYHLNGFVRFGFSLCIWSLVGLILCRRSAFLLTGDDDSSLPRTIDYGLRRWLTTLLCPLIPLIAAISIGLIAAIIGVFGRIPAVGPVWLLLISPISAALGLGMAFLFVAMLFSWPLMTAAVATDDCDSFGGLSRAFSMLTGQLWMAAGYLICTMVMGSIVFAVVASMGELTIWFATWTTAMGSGSEQARQSLAAPVMWIVHQIVAGIGTAYFWSAATLIYLLLRKEVDGVPIDRIAPHDDSRPAKDPLPVVGMPATDAKMDEEISRATIELPDVK
jgi:hypothetical protein